jgi:hypothetical protein
LEFGTFCFAPHFDQDGTNPANESDYGSERDSPTKDPHGSAIPNSFGFI